MSTQFLIFNLFGDYILPRGGRIWAGSLLHLLDLLGVSERAARSTLSRMKQEGWFTTAKHGRESQYILTDAGRAICEQGNQRIFEPPVMEWDGCWHLVVYSLPEGKRALRNELRTKLIWYGFGRLAPGTWISPHNWDTELRPILTTLGIENHVEMFSGQHHAASEQQMIHRCWDLSQLAQDYQTFLARYQPEYETLKIDVENGRIHPTPTDCFIRRFWLTYAFQTFPLHDPNLPAQLLPADWPGHTARYLFHAYRHLLNSYITDFLQEILS